jgi:hypothetical protein
MKETKGQRTTQLISAGEVIQSSDIGIRDDPAGKGDVMTERHQPNQSVTPFYAHLLVADAVEGGLE